MFRQSSLVQEMDGLRKFACRLTGDVSDAEDLLQATVLRALEKKHLFQPGTDLFKWMSRIMYNQFVSGYRRRTKFESKYDPQPYIDRLSILSPQEIQAELTEVGEAMALLSEEHRQILLMICIKGMKYKAVAKNLGIPVGTVRSRLSRAREQLQVQMEEGRFCS